MGSCCSQLSSPPQSPIPQISGLLQRLVCIKGSTYCSATCTTNTCPWRPIKCILDGRLLTYYELDDSVRAEKIVSIDANFHLGSERAHLMEIRVRLVDAKTGAIEKWKLRTPSPASFVTWSTSLKRSKRPMRVERLDCFECKKPFCALLRKLYCKSCGQAVCPQCSARAALLPHLGYSKQQRVCLSCFSLPFKPTSQQNNSMVATRVM
jgi:hypothetical protein